MLEYIKNNLTVLVTSCYSYKDVLQNFEFLFNKYWPDCPCDIYLNIDKDIDEHAIKYDKIIVSPHKQNLIRMREVVINTPYLLMIQDDHFLFDKVDNEKIYKCLKYANEYNCGNFRLMQDPKTAATFNESEDLLIYNPGAAYRISARGGLWRTDYWKMFVDKFDDLWQMEQQGQKFSCNYPDLVLCTRDRVLPMIDAVHKGYYEDFALILLEANAIYTDRGGAPSGTRLKETIKATIWEWNPNLIAKMQGVLHIGHKQKY